MWKRLYSDTSEIVRQQQSIVTTEDEEFAEYVDSKIIYQAGVDFESKPMVIICACNLPNPTEVDYDKILSRILRKLDLFAESDYTVVLFAGGVRHKPTFTWLYRAYKSLSRKYKKNLKSLYIVHTTTWSRLIIYVASLFISPKFGRKIKYIPTLSDLARYVPVTQIEIPPLVYTYNLQFEEKIITFPKNVDYENGPIMFGVPIEVLMGSEGEKGIPRVVKDCVNFIRAEGLDTEGIFRRSPSSVLLGQAREAYDRGNPINLKDYGVHVAAVLLKMFFASLPVPVFPAELYDTLRQIRSKDGHVERIEFIRNTLFPLLSPPIVILLHYVCSLLNDVCKNERVNRMTPYNLSAMITPNLVHSGNPLLDVSMYVLSTDSNNGGGVGIFMKLAIEHFELMFEGFQEPKERIRDMPVDSGIASTSSSVSETTELSTSPPYSFSASSGSLRYPSIRRMRGLASLSTSPTRQGSIRVGAGVEISGLMANGTLSRSPTSPFTEEPGSPMSMTSIDELRKAMPWTTS